MEECLSIQEDTQFGAGWQMEIYIGLNNSTHSNVHENGTHPQHDQKKSENRKSQ